MAGQRTLGAPVPLPTRHRRQVPYVGVADDRVYSDRSRQRHSSGSEDCLPQAPRGSGAPQATEVVMPIVKTAPPNPSLSRAIKGTSRVLKCRSSAAVMPMNSMSSGTKMSVAPTQLMLSPPAIVPTDPATRTARPTPDLEAREKAAPGCSRRAGPRGPRRMLRLRASATTKVGRRRSVRFRASCPNSRSPDKRESWRTRRCRFITSVTMPTLRRRAGQRASARGRARRFPSPPLRTQLCRES
jgi:hypothetical protein